MTGVSVVITNTMPSHPDLSFMLPASPGQWEALDERDGYNAGSIMGTYVLRDGIVPEPPTLVLTAMGLLAFGRRRRRNPARLAMLRRRLTSAVGVDTKETS